MKKKRIIWIDDNIETRLLRPYLDELEDNNFEVVKVREVINIMPFLKQEAKRKLDAIIVDVIMPPLDLDYSETRGGIRAGLVVLKKIMEDKEIEGIPIIVFSNMDDDVVTKFCRDNRILYLAKKEFFTHQFVNKLNEIIQKERIAKNDE